MSRHKEPRKRFAPFAVMMAAFAVLLASLVAGAGPAQAATDTCDKLGYTKIDQESGTATLPFGYIEWGGAGESTATTINYEVKADYTVTFCLKASTEVHESDPIVGPVSGTFDTGDKYQISHVGYTYNYECPDGTVWNDVNENEVEEEGECVTPPTPVAPTEPTPVDKCEPATGSTNDRIVIPSDANFTYRVDGKDVAAGEVVATGTSHTVTAVAKQGVVVKEGAKTSWTFTFTKVNCPVTPPPAPTCPNGTPWTDTNGNGMMDECNPPVVTPPVVTPPVVTPPETSSTELTKIWGNVRKVDKCGRAGDSFYAKRVKHGKYLVKGKAVREGVWLRAKTLVVKVKFVSTTKKHVAAGKDSWTLRFTNKSCVTPPKHLPPTGA